MRAIKAAYAVGLLVRLRHFHHLDYFHDRLHTNLLRRPHRLADSGRKAEYLSKDIAESVATAILAGEKA